MINILNYTASNWVLTKATLVDNVLTIEPGGTAVFRLTELLLSAVPDALVFTAKHTEKIDIYKPQVYGIFSAMYAKPLDSVSQNLVSDSGLSMLLPLTTDTQRTSSQKQLKYTVGDFTIYNKLPTSVVLTEPELLRSDIKYLNYTDENGFIDSNKTTYTLEVGHTLGDGTFYFNRSYVDEPYYTAPNNPSAVITPITNAANKFIGGTVTNAGEQKTFVVCYCVIPGD